MLPLLELQRIIWPSPVFLVNSWITLGLSNHGLIGIEPSIHKISQYPFFFKKILCSNLSIEKIRDRYNFFSLNWSLRFECWLVMRIRFMKNILKIYFKTIFILVITGLVNDVHRSMLWWTVTIRIQYAIYIHFECRCPSSRFLGQRSNISTLSLSKHLVGLTMERAGQAGPVG